MFLVKIPNIDKARELKLGLQASRPRGFLVPCRNLSQGRTRVRLRLVLELVELSI